jgi:hypothetical protein
MPKAFRTVLHGTCLLDGKHPPGSKLARECPVLRRAERLQARENEGACITPYRVTRKGPRLNPPNQALPRRVSVGVERSSPAGHPYHPAEQREKARERDRAYRARQRGLTPEAAF